MKRLFLLICLLPLPVAAQSTRVAADLRRDGVKSTDADSFAAVLDSARDCIGQTTGHLTALQPLPEPIDAAWTRVGSLSRSYHLNGAQTVELLGDVMTFFNPRLAEAAPIVHRLGATVRAVPGGALYEFMSPSLKEGLRHRLSGGKIPEPHMSFARLAEARSFAALYHLPFADLAEQLHELKAAIKRASP